MHQKQYYSIQYLRGIAAFLVVLYHANNLFEQYYDYSLLKGILYPGYMGVDIFFVISGFIIFTVHKHDIGLPDRSSQFFLKRFFRIYPVYWLILLAILPVYFIMPSFGQGYETDAKEIISSIFLLFPTENMPILVVAWTLQHEVLFYVLFGVLLILLYSKNKTLAKILIISWAILCFTSLFISFETMHPFYKLIFNPINLEFLMGCTIAWILNKKETKLKTAYFIFAFGITLLLISWFSTFLGITDFNRIFTWGIPSTILIMSLILIERKSNSKKNRLFILLGDASYSIYLTHYPAMSVINKTLLALNVPNYIGNFVTFLLTVIISVIIGCVFYLLIEKNIVRLYRKIINKQTRYKQIAS
jgi:exopolysaccharide production protein ExoZ